MTRYRGKYPNRIHTIYSDNGAGLIVRTNMPDLDIACRHAIATGRAMPRSLVHRSTITSNRQTTA